MDPMKPRRALVSALPAALPFALALAAALLRRPWLDLAALAALFAAVALLPRARGQESLWIALLAAPTCLAANVGFLLPLFSEEALSVDPLWINILRLLALTVLLFSGEELLLVLLSRLIWRRQRKIELPSLSERSLRAHRESKRR